MTLATEAHWEGPIIQSISKGEQVEYRLIEDYTFEWTEKGIRYRRTVFALEETDLASVPDGAALLGFRKCGCSDGASVVHDRGYEVFKELGLEYFPPGEFQAYIYDQWIDVKRKCTRLELDRLYKRMCIAGKMPRHRAEIEFLALRVGAMDKRMLILNKKCWAWYFS